MIKAKQLQWDGLRLKDQYSPFDIHIERHYSDISDIESYVVHFGYIESIALTEAEAKQRVQDQLTTFIQSIAESI